MTPVVVEPRFAGPPRSGQGGYVAGLLARGLTGPAEVTLRRPPPLATPLDVVTTAVGLELRDGDALVADAHEVDHVDVGEVPIVRYADAASAAGRALTDRGAPHPFPGCFGCGPDHPTGLHLLAGRVASMPGVFAVPWVPTEDLAGAGGVVRSEIVWAALDCPTFGPLFADGETAVLGRIAVEIRGPVGLGHRYVITTWQASRDGRKHHCAGAVSSDMGGALAVVRATWIEVDADAFNASVT